MRCERLAHSGDDFLAAGQQLADKLEANAPARTKYQPGGRFAVCIEYIRDLVHAGVAHEAGWLGAVASGRPRLRVVGCGMEDVVPMYQSIQRLAHVHAGKVGRACNASRGRIEVTGAATKHLLGTTSCRVEPDRDPAGPTSSHPSHLSAACRMGDDGHVLHTTDGEAAPMAALHPRATKAAAGTRATTP